jgi:hypothetical protein
MAATYTSRRDLLEQLRWNDENFTRMGRRQLEVLLHEGLRPESLVLDVGCGMLCGGYWVMRFLNPGCYFGIEPNKASLQAGLDWIMEPEVLAQAKPRFDNNDDFDLGVFDCKFDFVIARSIWTHASKPQIRAMLDGFVQHGAAGAVLMTTYVPAAFRVVPRVFSTLSPKVPARLSVASTLPAWTPRIAAHLPTRSDYLGEDWVGRTATCDVPGIIAHSFGWVAEECRRRELEVIQLRHLDSNRQRWLRIRRVTAP